MVSRIANINGPHITFIQILQAPSEVHLDFKVTELKEAFQCKAE